MTISTIEESEIPEHYSLFGITVHYKVAFTAGIKQIVAPGHHPKCRLVSGQVHPHAYSTAGSTYIVEDGDGNDASIVATTAVVDTTVDMSLIAGQVFERNEAICILSTQGNAANAASVSLLFESIH